MRRKDPAPPSVGSMPSPLAFMRFPCYVSIRYLGRYSRQAAPPQAQSGRVVYPESRLKHTSANLLPLVPAAVRCICSRLDFDFLLGLRPASHTCAVNRCAPDTPSCNGRLCLILSQRYNVNIQVNVPSAFHTEEQADGAATGPTLPSQHLVAGTGPFITCAYHQPLEIGWSCGNLDQGIPGRANWGLSRSILNSTPADRRAASLCERQDWRQWARGKPTHTSICNLPAAQRGADACVV